MRSFPFSKISELLLGADVGNMTTELKLMEFVNNYFLLILREGLGSPQIAHLRLG